MGVRTCFRDLQLVASCFSVDSRSLEPLSAVNSLLPRFRADFSQGRRFESCPAHSEPRRQARAVCFAGQACRGADRTGSATYGHTLGEAL